MSVVTFHVTHVTYHVSSVAGQLSPVTWHMSLTPTATATDPPLLTVKIGLFTHTLYMFLDIQELRVPYKNLILDKTDY